MYQLYWYYKIFIIKKINDYKKHQKGKKEKRVNVNMIKKREIKYDSNYYAPERKKLEKKIKLDTPPNKDLTSRFFLKVQVIDDFLRLFI